MNQKIKEVLAPRITKQIRNVKKTPEKWRILSAKRKHPPSPMARKLNLGAGYWYRPGWEVVDMYIDPWYIDYELDLRSMQNIPLPDGTVQIIFCSHVLEHVSDEACLFILKDCHRLLKPGGTIRISTPDMDKAIDAYRRHDMDWFRSCGVALVGDSLERVLVNYFASYKLDGYSGGPAIVPERVHARLAESDKHSFVKWCVSQIPEEAPYKAHVNGYDYLKMKSFLAEAGFRKIDRSDYRQSAESELRGEDFDNRPQCSLYVEAQKD